MPVPSLLSCFPLCHGAYAPLQFLLGDTTLCVYLVVTPLPLSCCRISSPNTSALYRPLSCQRYIDSSLLASCYQNMLAVHHASTTCRHHCPFTATRPVFTCLRYSTLSPFLPADSISAFELPLVPFLPSDTPMPFTADWPTYILACNIAPQPFLPY